MVEIPEICLENKVMLFCLLPQTSQLIQPLDQALFGSLKPAWGEASRKHIFQTGEEWGSTLLPGQFFKSRHLPILLMTVNILEGHTSTTIPSIPSDNPAFPILYPSHSIPSPLTI
ncbi:hypothetical protein PoB_000270700 [Plakobranchus ocellatus]|uniref:Uncharacterized protein n=1 Tax=Plakobranchus ocellatus TaxID=259542 RepID=A0AAV3Y0B1_9GAST|nr:hypothetical protein PoB_000270700 [Plakobranchus ocellatus]